MFNRIVNLEDNLDDATFLLGARQTGKSTLLAERFPKATYLDLLDSTLRRRLHARPELLREILSSTPDGSIVIIDEIPKVPDLLDEVHWILTHRDLKFILSGSSARRLKKSSCNTLGGRAIPMPMFPLVSAEIPNFDIYRAIQNGMLPRHYTVQDATRRIKAYVDIYLKEEIRGEALTRNIDSFERFLEIAAISDGEMLNYKNIASDCGVSANTVFSYFQILYDTLIGYEIQAYTKHIQRKLVQSPRFYFFDVGITNYLLGRTTLKPGTAEFGHAFEHLVIQELIAYMGYRECKEKLTYWRTYTGIEVDAIIGDARIAIEIKSTDKIDSKHKKNLKIFAQEHPDARKIIVSLDPLNRQAEGIEMMYVTHFFKELWADKII